MGVRTRTSTIAGATERGIPVVYTPGRNAESVADFAVGLLLAANRHIAHSHHLLQEREFTGTLQTDTATGGECEDVTWGVAGDSPYTELKGFELGGRTLGIVGFGAIGKHVARRADGFGMQVLASDPHVDGEMVADHGVEKVRLPELCELSDVVSVHAVVSEETRGLIGREEFELMDDDTVFVNTARASIASQEVLVETLRADGLGAAALDVYDREPLPADHELFEFDNVVTTPHIAAVHVNLCGGGGLFLGGSKEDGVGDCLGGEDLAGLVLFGTGDTFRGNDFRADFRGLDEGDADAVPVGPFRGPAVP